MLDKMHIDLPITGVASAYARRLLVDLGATIKALPQDFGADAGHVSKAELSSAEAWLDSGLLEISGSPAGPGLECPVPLASMADGTMIALNALLPFDKQIAWLGRRILGMRRLTHPLRRGGTVSAGGSCRLLPCADAWLAVNLARAEDWELLPAWLETEVYADWGSLAEALRHGRAADLLERARWLGLAVALNEPPKAVSKDEAMPAWFHNNIVATPKRVNIGRAPRVLDLSSLWAGPLCGQLLHQAGAEVIKIEHPQRPDGARRGPAGFYQALNEGKASLSLDLRIASDRARLIQEIEASDIVIEAFRPRVWAQFDLVPDELVRRQAGLSWISISGYGAGKGDDEQEANWIAYGDDAAVSAGLSWRVQEAVGTPMFCGDAIADPLAGLHAALLAWASYVSGGGRHLSIALRSVVAHCIACGDAVSDTR